MKSRVPLATRILLLLACGLLVMARVGGSHLHLCFDGTEPRSSLHLIEDGDADLHFGASSPHEDLDISAVGTVLVKQDSAGILLLPLLAAAIVLVGLLSRIFAPISDLGTAVPAPRGLFALRPPSRGPPR